MRPGLKKDITELQRRAVEEAKAEIRGSSGGKDMEIHVTGGIVLVQETEKLIYGRMFCICSQHSPEYIKNKIRDCFREIREEIRKCEGKEE